MPTLLPQQNGQNSTDFGRFLTVTAKIRVLRSDVNVFRVRGATGEWNSIGGKLKRFGFSSCKSAKHLTRVWGRMSRFSFSPRLPTVIPLILLHVVVSASFGVRFPLALKRSRKAATTTA
eukprot:331053-Rhodomonas_salina.3